MNVLPISLQTRYNSPIFKSDSARVPSNGIYNTTEFLREDFDCDGIINLINTLYDDPSKINVLFYACSNGKEVYSFDLRLRALLKDNAQKLYPLVAKDIDPNLILRARRGFYKISNEEEAKLTEATNNNLYRYVDIIDDGFDKFAKMKDFVSANVNFSTADICSDIDNIPQNPIVLICRNFWNYLSGEDQMRLVEKMGKNLKEKSLVALGAFDRVYGLDKLLKSKGFAETGIPNVLIKLAK